MEIDNILSWPIPLSILLIGPFFISFLVDLFSAWTKSCSDCLCSADVILTRDIYSRYQMCCWLGSFDTLANYDIPGNQASVFLPPFFVKWSRALHSLIMKLLTWLRTLVGSEAYDSAGSTNLDLVFNWSRPSTFHPYTQPQLVSRSLVAGGLMPPLLLMTCVVWKVDVGVRGKTIKLKDLYSPVRAGRETVHCEKTVV